MVSPVDSSRAAQAFVFAGFGFIPLCDRLGVARAWAIICASDFLDVARFSWYLNSRGYACRQVRRAGGGQWSLAMHRHLLGLGLGDAPGMHVDHINCNQLDNRRSNLHVVTVSANQLNRRHARKDSVSGLRGIRQRPDGTWQLRCQINGKRISIGGLASRAQALEAREAYYRERSVPNG